MKFTIFIKLSFLLPWKREKIGFHGYLNVIKGFIKKVILPVYEELIFVILVRFEEGEIGESRTPRFVCLGIFMAFFREFLCIFVEYPDFRLTSRATTVVVFV